MWLNTRNVLLSPILVPLPLQTALFCPKISEKWVKPHPIYQQIYSYSNLKEEMWLSDNSLLNEAKGWLYCLLDPFYLGLEGYPEQFILFLYLCGWKEAMSLLCPCQASAVFEQHSKSQATPHLHFFTLLYIYLNILS